MQGTNYSELELLWPQHGSAVLKGLRVHFIFFRGSLLEELYTLTNCAPPQTLILGQKEGTTEWTMPMA